MSGSCPYEERMLTELAQRGRLDEPLAAHVAACPECRDLASLVTALRSDAAQVAAEATLPTASQVWWRARVRARFEAAQAAERPISIVQSLAAAALAGLTISFINGPAIVHWLRHPMAVTAGWSPYAWATALACGVLVLLMPIAALLITSRE